MDFDCIYKSYYLDVYHFLCGLSSNKEIAEDITQETFTRIEKQRSDGMGSPGKQCKKPGR